MIQIAYCQLTWERDFPSTLQRVEESYKYVDYVVLAIHDCDQSHLKHLRKYPNVHTQLFEFNDNIPQARNVYLEYAKKLGVDWVIVSDPDEAFSEQFWRTIRHKIELAEESGVNMLGVRCLEQFEAREWLDNLDEIKESPAGYRESDFYKLLVFKLYPDVRYEGVGSTKNLHETWFSPSHNWVVRYLPREITYTHKKSALDIWRNAARNVFISGGGDNVGEGNPIWKELRDIARSKGFDKWMELQSYVEAGNLPKDELTGWCKKALTYSPTNWGTECREFAKWYFFYNQHLKDDEVEYGLKNPPKITPEIEVENYVTQSYFQILGRHPDENGKKFYTEKILKGEIKKEQLPSILMASEEYREKKLGGESVRVQIPVEVDIKLTEDILVKAIMQSKSYWEKIKPKLDLAEFIESFLDDKTAFYDSFYEIKTRSGSVGVDSGLDKLLQLIKRYKVAKK